MQNEKLKIETRTKHTLDIVQRTYSFALKIVTLCHNLSQTPGAGRVLGIQLLKAGTSIGANVEEAQAGQSKADFSCKILIALKEARETRYWLRLIIDSKVFESGELNPLLKEADELSRILGAIASRARR